MNTTKKLLCLLLALMMVLPLFAACNTKEKVVPVDIVSEGASDYKIIYPEDKTATEEQAAATALKEAISKATGVKLVSKNDYYPGTQPATAKEILVGDVRRTEVENAKALLREKDFVIAYENERVIILGGSGEATARAVEHFIATYVKADEKKVTVTEQLCAVAAYAYMLQNVSIDGVPLTSYTVVYPEKADLVTKYVAYNIADYFITNAGIELKVTSDKAKESEYEILVGATNRAASTAGGAVTRTADQYVLYKSDKKIVMQGDSYMVGGAAGAFVNQYVAEAAKGDGNVTNLPTVGKAEKHVFKKATSAILMIGDGMGFNHIEAAEKAGLTDFIAQILPGQGSCVTASASVLNGKADFTDSAAAATALATGYKTINGYIGVDQNKTSRQNVRELAHKKGAKTAVVTTDVITGATPAGFLCHESSRSSTAALQSQIDKLIKNGDVTYTAGGFAENKLTDYTREALRAISEGNGSFFAMIEEAHIDKHSHNNTLAKARLAVQYYNDVIAYVIGFVMMHPETALIITADHECGQLYFDESKGVFLYRPYGNGTYDHSNVNVPLFALGNGAEEFVNSKDAVDNTDIAKFIASVFGSTSFGG